MKHNDIYKFLDSLSDAKRSELFYDAVIEIFAKSDIAAKTESDPNQNLCSNTAGFNSGKAFAYSDALAILMGKPDEGCSTTRPPTQDELDFFAEKGIEPPFLVTESPPPIALKQISQEIATEIERSETIGASLQFAKTCIASLCVCALIGKQADITDEDKKLIYDTAKALNSGKLSHMYSMRSSSVSLVVGNMEIQTVEKLKKALYE